MTKTFAQIRAGGFLANGMQLVLSQQVFQPGDFRATRCTRTYPSRFRQRFIERHDLDRDARRFGFTLVRIRWADRDIVGIFQGNSLVKDSEGRV